MELGLEGTGVLVTGAAGGIGSAHARPRAGAGSPAGICGEAGHADYASAKAAMPNGLLLSLKNEIVETAPLARVTLVAPGWTVSPMTEKDLTEETVARVTATMPLRKVATAGDV